MDIFSPFSLSPLAHVSGNLYWDCQNTGTDDRPADVEGRRMSYYSLTGSDEFTLAATGRSYSQRNCLWTIITDATGVRPSSIGASAVSPRMASITGLHPVFTFDFVKAELKQPRNAKRTCQNNPVPTLLAKNSRIFQNQKSKILTEIPGPVKNFMDPGLPLNSHVQCTIVENKCSILKQSTISIFFYWIHLALSATVITSHRSTILVWREPAGTNLFLYLRWHKH